MSRGWSRVGPKEIVNFLERGENKSSLETIYCVSILYSQCLPCESYLPNDEWADAVSFTKTGNEVLTAVDAAKEFSRAEAALASVINLFCNEPLVDIERTDPSRVVGLASRDVREGKIRFPWIYTRELYDRFFEMFPPQHEDLEPNDSARLIDGMEQGVFQVGRLVVGPFGVLNSLEKRFLAPSRSIRLRVCANPTCDKLHPSTLHPVECGTSRLVSKIENVSVDYRRERILWDRSLMEGLDSREDVRSHTSLVQLGMLVATAFTWTELSELFLELVNTNPDTYRSAYGVASDGAERVTARAGDYASRQSQSHLLQQIFRSTNKSILAALDALIERGRIVVPSSEIRRSRFKGATTVHDVRAECSHLGVRLVPNLKGYGPRNLFKMVSEVHENQQSWNTLNYSLRRFAGASPADRLANYLGCVDPREALRSTLFVSDEHLEFACRALGFERYSAPIDEESEERLISSMLWKLGFDLPRQSSILSTMKSKLEMLSDVAQSQETYSVAKEEKVRSAAINTFVALENILTDALNFSGWALLNDHYSGSKFGYKAEEARDYLYALLNGTSIGAGSTLEFDRDGHNALFPLVEGFSALAQKCATFMDNPDFYLRDLEIIPKREQWFHLSAFLLAHTMLLLDLRSDQQTSILDTLRDITRTLNRANVVGIRNRLSHGGREFPDQNEIEGVVHAISGVLEVLETSGLYPMEYQRKSQFLDAFGRGNLVYENFRAIEIELIRPSFVTGCRMPDSLMTMIIVPALRLGPAQEPVRFCRIEESPFSNLWSNLPPRRSEINFDRLASTTDEYRQVSSLSSDVESLENTR